MSITHKRCHFFPTVCIETQTEYLFTCWDPEEKVLLRYGLLWRSDLRLGHSVVVELLVLYSAFTVVCDC